MTREAKTKALAEKILDTCAGTGASAVHDAMEHFTYHWAPAQPRKAAEFHADLLRLIQAVHRDSAKPMEIALKNAFAVFPYGFFQAPIAPAKVEVKE